MNWRTAEPTVRVPRALPCVLRLRADAIREELARIEAAAGDLSPGVAAMLDARLAKAHAEAKKARQTAERVGGWVKGGAA